MQLKRAGRSRDPKKPQRKLQRKQPSRGRGPCYVCGAEGQRNNDEDEISITEDDEYVYLDRCASESLFILLDQSFFESFVRSGGSIQITRVDAQLSCLRSGRYCDWSDIGCAMMLSKYLFSWPTQRHGLRIAANTCTSSSAVELWRRCVDSCILEELYAVRGLADL